MADTAPGTAPDFGPLLDRFLGTGRRDSPPPRPAGTTTHSLTLATPPGWSDGPAVTLRVHQRGSGPAALLVHGWRGSATDLDALAARLLDDGFSVWQPDLPGHGASDGARLSLPLAAQALHAVQAAAGPFAFAAAHSYGGAALVQALATGLQVPRVALLAPPTHYGQFARRAAQMAGLPAEHIGAWLQALARTIGADPDRLNMRQQVAALRQAALLVHSSDDPIAPFDAIAAVAAAWPGARWQPCEGLGHVQLLSDDATLQVVRQFASGG